MFPPNMYYNGEPIGSLGGAGTQLGYVTYSRSLRCLILFPFIFEVCYSPTVVTIKHIYNVY